MKLPFILSSRCRWLPGLALAVSLLAVAWSAPLFAQSPRGQDAAIVWRLIDYVAVDYPSTVQDGKIISAAEYQEMQEFAATIAGKVAALPDSAAKTALRRGAAQLLRMIDEAPPVDGFEPLEPVLASRAPKLLGS